MSEKNHKATNFDIAKAFGKIAEILEIQGENVFRVRAYERAAQMIDGLPEECGDIYEGGLARGGAAAGLEALKDISGIGEDLSLKIEEMLKTGKLEALQKLEAKVPAGILDIMSVEGMGPKKTKFVWKKFDVKSLKDLEELAKSGKLLKIKGWGEKSVENILHGIELLKKFGDRVPIQVAMTVAEAIVAALKESKLCVNIEIAGSLRRMKETIGDIDILVTSNKPEKVLDLFESLPLVKEKMVRGPTKSTVLLKMGLEADIRVLSPEIFGAGLYYFTGSKEHHVVTRTMAVKKGITISEYGAFKGTKEHKRKLIAAKTEEDLFQVIGLPYIAPELREARGEVEAALRQAQGKLPGLPKLVEEKDIRGDLHMHSDFSDGTNTILEMAHAAKEFGYEYIALTDHSSSMGMVKGVKADNIDYYLKMIEEARKKVPGIHILSGAEVDIGKDGSLYFHDEYLKRLDWVIASVHLNLKMTADEMTKRYLKAIENPYVNMIAHPTSRIVGQRAPFEFDFIKVAKHAKEYNVALEINASERLDLNDVHIRQAKEVGVKFVINSDAHVSTGLSLRFGVGQARRGWCEKQDVLNCLPWEEFKRHL